jgi:hypothetical protein
LIWNRILGTSRTFYGKRQFFDPHQGLHACAASRRDDSGAAARVDPAAGSTELPLYF